MSLEGKANRLASMIRGNLAMAMQGLSVVPCSPASTCDTGIGRIFSYDVTGGCYEEHDHHSVGSGSLFARGALKKVYRRGLAPATTRCAIAVEALYDAADDDSATGGPDVGRRIWPTVAHRRRRGHRASCPTTRSRRWSTRSSPRGSTTREVRDDRRHAVLRLARAADEGPGRLRAQGHRPRPLGRRARLRRRHRLRRREPQPGTAQGLRDLRPDRLRRGRQVQRVREPARRRRRATPTCAATPTTAPTSPPAAWPTPTPRPSARSSPRSPSPTRSRSSWPRSARAPRPTRSTGSPTTARSADEHGFVAMGGASRADRGPA